MSDFDMLRESPSAGSGFNAPTVSTKLEASDAKQDYDSYLVPRGAADIFFPTNFRLLRLMHLFATHSHDDEKFAHPLCRETVGLKHRSDHAGCWCRRDPDPACRPRCGSRRLLPSPLPRSCALARRPCRREDCRRRRGSLRGSSPSCRPSVDSAPRLPCRTAEQSRRGPSPTGSTPTPSGSGRLCLLSLLRSLSAFLSPSSGYVGMQHRVLPCMGKSF